MAGCEYSSKRNGRDENAANEAEGRETRAVINPWWNNDYDDYKIGTIKINKYNDTSTILRHE